MSTAGHSLEGKPCLVTGASGFLGRHLVRALRARGARVRALDVRAPEQAPAGVETIEGDIRDRALLDDAVAG